MDTRWRDHTNDEPGALEHLLASGEMLASQTAEHRPRSPERRLAAAVLTQALANIHDHYGQRKWAQQVEADLAWVRADDPSEAFGFVGLCDAFGLDPTWVRERVEAWCRGAQRRTDAAGPLRCKAA
jgi:hypothetical protein